MITHFAAELNTFCMFFISAGLGARITHAATRHKNFVAFSSKRFTPFLNNILTPE